ncbi:MAG: tryptophan-rich sensory protein [Candidatus Pacebacteria bacterium]|nr:tryptophan-rich sensory protein [Candidatus Paceibacterota bacterium]
MKKNYFSIPLITIIVAVTGSYFTAQGMGWYDGLILPEIAPGGGFIGAVWTVIFFFSTLSALLFYNAPRKKLFSIIVILFIANAIFNVLWSFLFFTLHLFWQAIVEMIILNVLNLLLIKFLWNYKRLSALLLVPYFVWVCFATYLAYLIAVGNM